MMTQVLSLVVAVVSIFTCIATVTWVQRRAAKSARWEAVRDVLP